MKKNYFFYLLVCLFSLSSLDGFSQDLASNTLTSQHIKGLSVFPNPVNNGASKIFIETTLNRPKQISIFNVLGKQIVAPVVIRKELDISNLRSGVYVLKITEGSVSETRKLVIR